jgi:hypothetical protein
VVFGRRTPTESNDAPELVEEPTAKGAAYSEAKGQPTPKRADARKARRSPTTGSSTADQRAKVRADRQRARQALISGDERFLPARDAGPERRLARDVVDSRFTLGQIMLIVIVGVFFLGSFIPNTAVQAAASYGGLIALLLIVVDSARHGRAAKAAVAQKFPNASVTGIASYAFLRAMLPRRFRRPPPKVERGAVVG